MARRRYYRVIQSVLSTAERAASSIVMHLCCRPLYSDESSGKKTLSIYFTEELRTPSTNDKRGRLTNTNLAKLVKMPTFSIFRIVLNPCAACVNCGQGNDFWKYFGVETSHHSTLLIANLHRRPDHPTRIRPTDWNGWTNTEQQISKHMSIKAFYSFVI